jgi:hypothetical protein
MAYYCGTCGSKLKSVQLKGDTSAGTKWISYKVFHVTTHRTYKCPNGCELKTVTEGITDKPVFG